MCTNIAKTLTKRCGMDKATAYWQPYISELDFANRYKHSMQDKRIPGLCSKLLAVF